MYNYVAKVLKVIDGDTIVANVDLGFDINVKQTFRFNGINAYETKLGKSTTIELKAKGIEAKVFLQGLIEGQNVVIQTFKDDKEKYGRYLATIFIQESQDTFVNVNELMIKKGYAISM